MAVKSKRNPNTTKSGKPRLGGLTVAQLTAMLDKEGKPKIRAKIRNRIRIVTGRPGYVAPPVVQTEAAE